MTWLGWLMLVVILVAFAAITGLTPKGGRPAARTSLMTVARVVLLFIVLILVYVFFREG